MFLTHSHRIVLGAILFLTKTRHFTSNRGIKRLGKGESAEHANNRSSRGPNELFSPGILPGVRTISGVKSAGLHSDVCCPEILRAINFRPWAKTITPIELDLF